MIPSSELLYAIYNIRTETVDRPSLIVIDNFKNIVVLFSQSVYVYIYTYHTCTDGKNIYSHIHIFIVNIIYKSFKNMKIFEKICFAML
jgi:hypothetical protein